MVTWGDELSIFMPKPSPMPRKQAQGLEVHHYNLELQKYNRKMLVMDDHDRYKKTHFLFTTMHNHRHLFIYFLPCDANNTKSQNVLNF